MMPSGKGANLAMFDGAELARHIAANPTNIEAALTAHEPSFSHAAPPKPSRQRPCRKSSSVLTPRKASSTSSTATERA